MKWLFDKIKSAYTFVREKIPSVPNLTFDNTLFLIKTGISIFIVTWKFETSLFLNLITHDSVISSIDFMINTIAQKKYKCIYNESIFDRYLYYTALTGIYFLTNVVFWGYATSLIYICLLLFAIPLCSNYILSTHIWRSCTKSIITTLYRLCYFLFYHILSYIINTICRTTLHQNPQISPKEIKHLVSIGNLSYLIEFVKIVLLTSLMIYIEYISPIYRYLGKLLYQYICQFKLAATSDPYPYIKHPKEKLLSIINSRQWHLFANPNVLLLLLTLYQNNNKSVFKRELKITMNTLKWATFNFSTIYSLVSIFNQYYQKYYLIPFAIPLISFILLFSRNYRPSFFSILVRLLTLVYIYFTPNILAATILSEFLDLLHNKLTLWIISKIYTWLIHNYYKIIAINTYNYHLLVSMCCYALFAHLLPPATYFFIPLTALFSRYPYISLYFSIFGLFSNFNPLHLICLATVFYLSLNIINIPSAKPPPVPLAVIEDYNIVPFAALEAHDLNKSFIILR